MAKTKNKSKRKAIEKTVIATNRWGCGIMIALFIAMILAMIFAGANQ